MSQTPPTTGIDPLTFARFLVLPRAVELLEAFAAIPPGRLRDTVIEHAKALGEAHSDAPAQYRQPDPLPAALGLPKAAPPAITARDDVKPPVGKGDRRLQAVQMRLDGKQPWQIAKAVKLTLSAVYGAITDARKAGVKFPEIPRAKPGKGSMAAGRFVMKAEDLTDPKAAHAMQKAAASRGLTLEDYLGRRALAVKMGLEGRHIRAIMESTKEDKTTLTTWFTSARGAGYPIPYMMDSMITHFEDAPPLPGPEVVDLAGARRQRTAEPISSRGLGAAAKAAERLGLTVDQYVALRERAFAMFAVGAKPLEVAKRLKIDKKQASNWREKGIETGRLQRAQA